MRSIVLCLVHGRPPSAFWGQVAPAGTVVWVWASRIIGFRPVPLAWAIALSMYAMGIWLIYSAFFSQCARERE